VTDAQDNPSEEVSEDFLTEQDQEKLQDFLEADETPVLDHALIVYGILAGFFLTCGFIFIEVNKLGVFLSWLGAILIICSFISFVFIIGGVVMRVNRIEKELARSRMWKNYH
jgi:hypothetical protein